METFINKVKKSLEAGGCVFTKIPNPGGGAMHFCYLTDARPGCPPGNYVGTPIASGATLDACVRAAAEALGESV